MSECHQTTEEADSISCFTMFVLYNDCRAPESSLCTACLYSTLDKPCCNNNNNNNNNNKKVSVILDECASVASYIQVIG